MYRWKAQSPPVDHWECLVSEGRFCFYLLVLRPMCYPTGSIALNQCIYCVLQDSTLFLSLSWYISCVFSRPFQYSVRLDDFVWCCYVIRPLEPMVMGPLSQFLRCEVFPLVGCYVIWDSMSVGQIFYKRFTSGMAGALWTGKENPYME